MRLGSQSKPARSRARSARAALLGCVAGGHFLIPKKQVGSSHPGPSAERSKYHTHRHARTIKPTPEPLFRQEGRVVIIDSYFFNMLLIQGQERQWAF